MDPEIGRPLPELGMVKSVDVGSEGTVDVEVFLTVAGCPMRDRIIRDVTAAVSRVPGVTGVTVRLDVMSAEQRQGLQTTLRGGRPVSARRPGWSPGGRARSVGCVGRWVLCQPRR